MEKKKLCLVIHSLETGGMERVMSELAAYFCNKPDLEVHLVMYGIKPEIFYSIPENLIVHKPSFVFNNKKRLLFNLKTMLFLRKTLKQISPVSVLSFGEYWNSFVLISTIGINCPVFVSDRSQPDKRLAFPHEYLRKWLYVRAKGVIAQTEKAKEIYTGLYKHKNIRVIGNPIKRIDINKPFKRENIIISVGRLIESKHHNELIRMFVNINMPGWKLIIVGDDAIKQKNKKKLDRLIKELNSEEIVELAGKRTDVENYYMKSKIFAFTSSSEGFPNVIGEAMSAGLPVVAWNCIAGPSELVINDKNGFLIPLFEKELFEAKLKELMQSELLISRMGEEARKKAKEFGIDVIGACFQKFILEN